MYKEQWDRIQRWLTRIERHHENQTEYVDFLWSFFQNCWHFKDWVKNDPRTTKKVLDSIEDDINKSDSLKICADLANRSKHFVLQPGRARHDKDPRLRGHIKADIKEDISRGTTTSDVMWNYVVHLDDGSERPVIELAHEALQGWKSLLNGYGMSV